MIDPQSICPQNMIRIVPFYCQLVRFGRSMLINQNVKTTMKFVQSSIFSGEGWLPTLTSTLCHTINLGVRVNKKFDFVLTVTATKVIKSVQTKIVLSKMEIITYFECLF